MAQDAASYSIPFRESENRNVWMSQVILTNKPMKLLAQH